MLETHQVMVVEDEKEIRELMALHLLRQGYKVTECSRVEEAQEKLKEKSFDLLVLDWMLPGASGIELVQSLRQTSEPPRVLMVTAKTEPQDIVEGLENGADDYLTKPFDPAIFMARVRALLRRTAAKTSANSEILELLGLRLNQNSYEVTLNGEPLHLTPSEFKLLATMMAHPGRVLTRDQLIEKIQGEGVNVVGRTIDTHVFGLRKKLSTWGDYVETIRGVGYRVKIED